MFKEILKLSIELTPTDLLSGLIFNPFKIVDSKIKQVILDNESNWLKMPENTPEEFYKKLQIVIHNAFVMDVWEDTYKETPQFSDEVLLWLVKLIQINRAYFVSPEFIEEIHSTHPDIFTETDYAKEWKQSINSLETLAITAFKKDQKDFSIKIAKYFIYVSQLRVKVSVFNNFISKEGLKNTVMNSLKSKVTKWT